MKPTSKVIPLEVGDSVSFSKTVGESDDTYSPASRAIQPNHINEEIMIRRPLSIVSPTACSPWASHLPHPQ
jgi:hypothetical protein